MSTGETKMPELSERVKGLLSLTVEAWADENLTGKPALLANCVFFNMEKALLREQAQIVETFGA